MQAITLEEIAARLRTLRRGKMFIATFINECNVQDMIPVVHGHWIERIVRGDKALYCSECDTGIDAPYHYKYCPNCGARMGEDER